MQRTLRSAPWLICGLYTALVLSGIRSWNMRFVANVLHVFLMLSLTAAFAFQVQRRKEQALWFWVLMTIGVALWSTSDFSRCFYDLFPIDDRAQFAVGHFQQFLHLIPMIAALSITYSRKQIHAVTLISLAMVAIWWIFLYTFMVIPWRYAVADPNKYNWGFATLYIVECAAYSIRLITLWTHSPRSWRRLYSGLFLGHIVSAVGTLAAVSEAHRGAYHGGSAFSLLFVLPVALTAYSAATFTPPEAKTPLPIKSIGINRATWLSVVGIASIPILIGWNIWSTEPSSVRDLRFLAGAIASMVLALMLFSQQLILTKDRASALTAANDSLAELERVQGELEYRATHDALTKCLNRASVLLALEREVHRNHRLDSDLAVLIIDLDHFKRINDQYGHLAGDTTLLSAAMRMKECIRANDYFGRYGGEEFLAVIPDCEFHTALDVANRICSSVSEVLVQHDDVSIAVTVTIGIASYRLGDTSKTILHRADLALYRGKSLGRNRVEIEKAQDVLLLPLADDNTNVMPPTLNNT